MPISINEVATLTMATAAMGTFWLEVLKYAAPFQKAANPISSDGPASTSELRLLSRRASVVASLSYWVAFMVLIYDFIFSDGKPLDAATAAKLILCGAVGVIAAGVLFADTVARKLRR